MANNIPQPFSANVRVPTEAPAAQARGANAVAQGIAVLSDSADQAYSRIQNRREAVDTVRAIRGYEQAAQAEYRRLLTEGDFSDPAVAETFSGQLREQQDQILNDWQGSPDAKVRLFERLDGIRSNLTDQAAVTSITEGRRLLTRQIDGVTRELADGAYKDPGAMSGLFERLDENLADMAPGMTQEDFLVAQEAGRQQIVLGAATRLLDQGNVDGAEEILAVPGVLDSLDATTARQIRTRVATQRQALAKADQAGLAKLREFEQIVGRPPTAQERLRMAGAGGSTAASLSDKVRDFENVIGRPATEQEVQKMAGADVDTGGFGFGKGMSGIALANLTNGSETFARGMMTPDEERNFESSVVAFMTPQRDPDTGSITQPILPPHVADALEQRGYRFDINNGTLIRPGGLSMADRASQGSLDSGPAQIPPELQGGNPDQTVWNMAELVTGVGPSVINSAGRAPIVGDNIGNAQITQAKTYVTNLSRDLIKVLQNNPRYAEGERQAIENEVSIDGSVWDNPTAYKNRLIGLDDALQKRAQFAYKTANNPNVGREERISAMNILNAVVNFRQNLGIPPRVKTAQDWNNIPAGQEYIDPTGEVRVKGGSNGEK